MASPNPPRSTIRHDWSVDEVVDLLQLPFSDLLFRAQQVHREYFDPNAVQVSQLLSIKTGACPEDCKYCPQSNRYDTDLEQQKLLEVEQVLQEARAAKRSGATRFCMGAAWRSPKQRDMPYLLKMLEGVKSLGLETCMTLGMLTAEQARELAGAGLDYYNHNLDTSPEYYGDIISTRSYQQRLETLERVRAAGINVCSGGILGMGESLSDRAGLLVQLANLPAHPQSVPINQLVRVAGTPLEDQPPLDPFEFVRTIAVARIMMPASHVRLSAGRQEMDDATQALAFLAGANSIFYGDKLLTTDNPAANEDMRLFRRLGIQVEGRQCQQAAAERAPTRQLFYDAAAV